MKNGTIDIVIFSAMDSITQKYKIADGDWAKESGIYQQRISELRLKARIGDDMLTGRAFSFEKCVCLLNGLRKLIGKENMSKEIMKLLERAKSTRERILLLACAVSEEDEKQAEAILRAIVQKEK